jgi:hypothetical protein
MEGLRPWLFEADLWKLFPVLYAMAFTSSLGISLVGLGNQRLTSVLLDANEWSSSCSGYFTHRERVSH